MQKHMWVTSMCLMFCNRIFICSYVYVHAKREILESEPFPFFFSLLFRYRELFTRYHRHYASSNLTRFVPCALDGVCVWKGWRCRFCFFFFFYHTYSNECFKWQSEWEQMIKKRSRGLFYVIYFVFKLDNAW